MANRKSSKAQNKKKVEKPKAGYNYPSRIEFLTDGTVVEYDHTLHKNTHRSDEIYVFRYVEAINPKSLKLGTYLPLKSGDIEALNEMTIKKLWL